MIQQSVAVQRCVMVMPPWGQSGKGAKKTKTFSQNSLNFEFPAILQCLKTTFSLIFRGDIFQINNFQLP